MIDTLERWAHVRAVDNLATVAKCEGWWVDNMAGLDWLAWIRRIWWTWNLVHAGSCCALEGPVNISKDLFYLQ